MSQTPYNYFIDIYKNSNEAVLCVNESLRVVYVSDAFKYNYGFEITKDVMANCCMSSSYLDKIRNCIITQTSESFVYNNILTNTPKKCLIIPTQVNEDKFVSIFIFDLDLNEFDNIVVNELRKFLQNNEEDMQFLLSSIVVQSRRKGVKLSEDMKSNMLFRNALAIRRKFEQLTFIFRQGIKSHNYYLMQVPEYILRTEKLAQEILGEDRINFINNFPNGIIVTEFCLDTFDMIMSNAISLLLQNTTNKTDIYVKARLHSKGSFVILAKDEKKCNELESQLNAGISNHEPVANLKLIEKIVKSYQGLIVVDKDNTKGFSIGFTLPPKPKRVEILRQPVKDKAKEHPELSIFSSMLSEFVNNK